MYTIKLHYFFINNTMAESKKLNPNTEVIGDNKPKTKYLLIFGLICSVIFLVVSFYPLIIGIFFHSSQERGFAGDMYGALNTLFSGLAFAGIIITIITRHFFSSYPTT
jgi:energy-coupling factor transporter transmembrane protein EcfT